MTRPTPTPGPWEAVKALRLLGEDAPVVSIYAGGELVADCCGPDAEANARLLAAAPDLLDALDWLMETAQAAAPSVRGRPFDSKRWELGQAIDDARSALAKARGEGESDAV